MSDTEQTEGAEDTEDAAAGRGREDMAVRTDQFKTWCRPLAAVLVAVGLAASLPADAGTLQQVLSRGNMRVGISLAAPWAMRDDDSGELSGFEIDVARKLAADLDVSVEFVRYDNDRLVRALEAGEIDLIAAGMTISVDRARHVNFSRPYAVGGVAIATNLTRTADVTRFEDLSDDELLELEQMLGG